MMPTPMPAPMPAPPSPALTMPTPPLPHDPQPQAPSKPGNDECCHSGCTFCVLEMYQEDLAAYEEALRGSSASKPLQPRPPQASRNRASALDFLIKSVPLKSVPLIRWRLGSRRLDARAPLMTVLATPIMRVSFSAMSASCKASLGVASQRRKSLSCFHKEKCRSRRRSRMTRGNVPSLHKRVGSSDAHPRPLVL